MKANECYLGRIVRHREYGACKVVKRTGSDDTVEVAFGAAGWGAQMTVKTKDLFPIGKEPSAPSEPQADPGTSQDEEAA